MLAIRSQPLPYVDRLPRRSVDTLDLVVVHCTELPDLAMARAYGERVLYADGTGNSGHYYIDRDGAISCYVPIERTAHHTHGYNERSIGIELVNLGRYPDWFDSRQQRIAEAYPDPQIQALIDLVADLRTTATRLNTIAGHEDLDTAQVPASDDPTRMVQRKLDPGPPFPWPRVLAACGLKRLGKSARPV